MARSVHHNFGRRNTKIVVLLPVVPPDPAIAVCKAHTKFYRRSYIRVVERHGSGESLLYNEEASVKCRAYVIYIYI